MQVSDCWLVLQLIKHISKTCCKSSIL